jgi:hypothetical protein
MIVVLLMDYTGAHAWYFTGIDTVLLLLEEPGETT